MKPVKIVAMALMMPLAVAAVALGASGPIAKLGAPQTAKVGDLVKFDASASMPSPNASIVSYTWSFDDGGKAIGVRVNHTFAKPGAYNVTLAIVDSKAQTASASVPVTILSGNSTTAPPTNATKPPTNGTMPTPPTKPPTNATSPTLPTKPTPPTKGPAPAAKPSAPAAAAKPAPAKTESQGAPKTVPGLGVVLVAAIGALSALALRRRT